MHSYNMSHLYSYLQPPSAWVSCPLESRELLSLCLKKIKGLSKVHLVDAGFVWTEPHSKRIKVKLTIQKEVCVVNCMQTETSKITFSLRIGQVFGGAILQQTFVVEFVVNNQMCDDCRRREARDYWRSVVQVRQKVCTEISCK